MISVMVVDDHAVVRKGLKTLLELSGNCRVVAEAGSAAEAVERAQTARPDLVVMDVRLPDRSGIEACRDIRAERPQTRVIMLTSYPDEQAMMASVMAGASGYLLKDLDEVALQEAIQIVAKGGSLLSPDLVARVLSDLNRRTQPGDRLEDLTEQERQILLLVAQGKTNREIAAEVFLSENTVRNYVSHILQKLGLSRRSEAAAYAARRGLTPPPTGQP